MGTSIMNHNIVYSTVHQSKGLERQIVFALILMHLILNIIQQNK